MDPGEQEVEGAGTGPPAVVGRLAALVHKSREVGRGRRLLYRELRRGGMDRREARFVVDEYGPI